MTILIHRMYLAIIVISTLSGALSFVPRLANIRLASLSSTPKEDVPLSANAAFLAPKAVEAAKGWLFQEPLRDIVPKESLSQAVKELQGNALFWDTNKSLYDKWFSQFERTIRGEKRPLKEILGVDAVNTLLNQVEKADVYDPTTVRAFLSNPAFETMIGGILYEGIFEFIQRVDIIGNIVNGLPIIGPMRKTIMAEFKKNLDKTLGGQVKTFLSSFNRIAVQRMIEFILSPSNRLSLQKANRNVVASLLDRPFSSVMPNVETTAMLRDKLWTLLRETPNAEAVSIVDLLYEQVGENKITDFADASKLLDAMPSAKKALEENVGRFLDTEEGISLLKDMASVALK